MPILCSVVFSQTRGKTAKKVRIDFFTANIDSGYQSCVCFNEKFSPYPKRKKRNARIQVQHTDLKMDLYLL